MKTNWKITYFGRLGIFCIVFKLFNQNIQYYVTKLKENCFLCKSEIEQDIHPKNCVYKFTQICIMLTLSLLGYFS